MHFIWEFLWKCINDENACRKCIFFIFVYWMHETYIKSIFYWMNNNMKMNSILFVSLFVLNKILKMNALTLFETIFFLRMCVCYLHKSASMIHETLDENNFYKMCMDVWSLRWMHEWMKPLFFNIMRMYGWMKIYSYICINGCM